MRVWQGLAALFAVLTIAGAGRMPWPAPPLPASRLTLDEFAMWLRLADVYWTPEGVASLKASALVAALLALYGFGQPFWHAVVRDVVTRTHEDV
jgi:hypothetical protein